MPVVARSQTSATAATEMRRRHLPPVMFLAVLLLVTLSFCRHLLLPRGPSQSQQTEDDTILCRLSAIDVGGDQIVAEAATMLANASISSSPSHDNFNHRLLYLRLPYSSNGTSGQRQRTMLCLRVPSDTLPTDGSLLSAPSSASTSTTVVAPTTSPASWATSPASSACASAGASAPASSSGIAASS